MDFCFTLDLAPYVQLTDEQFYDLCQRHDFTIERSAQGELEIVTPTGGSSGRRNAALNALLYAWCAQDGSGILFDSSTMFALPSGAMRSPDAAWVRRERWEALTLAEQERFPPLCPDFVVEILSPSDRLSHGQRKLEEYLANGAGLGWLIDPRNREAAIYRPGQPVERVAEDGLLTGLPGLALPLRAVL